MSDVHIVNHVFVVRAGLIVHAPASIYELQTPLLYEHADLILDILRLSFPPHAEELHFDLSEPPVWII